MDNSGYRTAFKGTALFGGVQFVTIIISVLKSKIIAIWLGTFGFGIISLLNSTIELIFSVSNLGLQSSAVRDIACSNGNGDTLQTAGIAKAIDRWVRITGLCGALVTIALSPLLSRWLFENSEYTVSFALLSVVIILMSIYNGNYAVLQGTRKLKLMAKANIFGALAGFLCALPVYYFFRDKGIVFALILTALMTALVSSLYVRKIQLPAVKQTYRESFRLGTHTVKLGIMMALSGIAIVIVQFGIKAFVKRHGGLDNVGLYEAGWALNTSYLGLVFTAMAKDYFPRLSQQAENDEWMKNTVNQQGEIAILILAPLIICMSVFMPFMIKLLYSSDFLKIVQMTQWLLLGSFLKAGSWAISYTFLAKGDGRTYLFNELGIKCINFPMYLLAYYFLGLPGIGYAFTFNYVIYLGWVIIVTYKKYRWGYTAQFWKLFALLFILLLGYTVLSSIYRQPVYGIGILMIVLTTVYSVYKLNERIDIREIISAIFKK